MEANYIEKEWRDLSVEDRMRIEDWLSKSNTEEAESPLKSESQAPGHFKSPCMIFCMPVPNYFDKSSREKGEISSFLRGLFFHERVHEKVIVNIEEVEKLSS